jgi:hypothetical protein
MAYNGNNLSKLGGQFDGRWNMWVYRSADTFATVKAANFISDGFARGLAVRDLIIIEDTATPATTLANVLTCTNAPACTISQTGVVVAE